MRCTLAASLTRRLLQVAAISAAAAGALAQVGPTGVQAASPSTDQPGVGFDGSAPGCPSPLLSLAYNPGENIAPGERTLDGLDLFTGGYHVHRMGGALPAILPIFVGESYNGKAVGGPADSYQGLGRNQSAQPEIVYDDETDQVHLVYAANKFVTYELEGEGSEHFVGIDGAAGFFEWRVGG